MSPAPSRRAQTFSAILFIVVGYFAYNVADLCSKVLQQHYSVYQVLGSTGAFGFLVTSLWLAAKHGLGAFFPPNWPMHVMRGLFVLGTAYFMVSALRTLPLADFYGIIFIMPFLVMILAVIVLKEKVGWRRWMAAGVGFAGILILAGPQFETIETGFVLALLGALCAALNIITLRKIGHGGPIALYGVYPFFFIMTFNLAGLWITGGYVPFRMEDMPWYLCQGPVVILGLICISLGFSKAPEAAVVAPFHYTQIIWGVMFGWYFFGVLPVTTTWIGLALVSGAGLYSLWREYRTHHPV